MNRLNENMYQPGRACSDDNMKLILRMNNLPITLYPTGLVDVMESAHSDFERVHPDEFDTLTSKQEERHVEYNNIHTLFDETKAGLDQSKCNLTAFCAVQTERVLEMGVSLKKQKVEVIGLIDKIKAQEQLIVDHQVELDELALKRRVDDMSHGAITDYDNSCALAFDKMCMKHFLTACGPGADVNCAKLQLVAQQIVLLVKRMVHVRALGLYLSREQVSDVYDSLDLGDLVDFSGNPAYIHHLFGESDYENFSSQFLLSALVEGDEDSDRIIVSNHIFQYSKYGVGKVPDPTIVSSILDKYVCRPIG